MNVSFSILKGRYDFQTGISYLYVRPEGLDACFTVMTFLSGQDELDSLIGKVVTDVEFSSTLALVKETNDKVKTLKFFNGSAIGPGFGEPEDVVILNGQYIEKVRDQDGVDECLIDSVFPFTVSPDDEFDLDRNLGKWVEVEVAFILYFNKVLKPQDVSTVHT